MTKVYLILHDIRSAENVGSIFRTADCAGVQKIYLSGYTSAPIDRFGRKRKDISKVALGAEENIYWEQVKSLPQLIKKLQKEHIKVIALEQDKRSVDYKKIRSVSMVPIAMIVGNEVNGIPEKILKMCDQTIEIPMHGKKESLNVSVAAGIALFRLLGR